MKGKGSTFGEPSRRLCYVRTCVVFNCLASGACWVKFGRSKGGQMSTIIHFDQGQANVHFYVLTVNILFSIIFIAIRSDGLHLYGIGKQA